MSKESSLEKPEPDLFAEFGISHAVLLDEATLVLSFRGGFSLSSWFRTGIFLSTVALDNKNKQNIEKIQSVDYNAMGVICSFVPFERSFFALSIPILVGGGFVNIYEKGSEDSKSKDAFFLSEIALHARFHITSFFHFGIGGGYRLFLDIKEDYLQNKDFNTPFGELIFYWGK